MNCLKSLTWVCLAALGAPLTSCRTIDASDVKADIHKVDSLVRVVYKDVDGFVYLVTCPKENGDVNDHAFDDQALSRSACNAKKADVASDGHVLVKKLKFDAEYLPKLKTALGLSPGGPTTAADVTAVQNQITVQQDHLNKLAQLAVTAQGVNKAQIDEQIAAIDKKLTDLKASLGQAASDQTQLAVLNALIGFLDINSTATFNIAEQNAGFLLKPFDGAPDVGTPVDPGPTPTLPSVPTPAPGAVVQITSDGTDEKPGISWSVSCVFDNKAKAASAAALCKASGFSSGKFVSASNDPCTSSHFFTTFTLFNFESGIIGTDNASNDAAITAECTP